MTKFWQVLAGGVLSLSAASLAQAQSSAQGPQNQATPPTPPQAQTAAQKPPEQKPAEQKPPDPAFKENVVVSASKMEQKLVDAPATMTVIGPKQLEVAPSSNFAEILRAVPGLNITQLSARDVNVNSRNATSSLATAQLTVVDGRSVYQDFFGFTMWEFVPSNLDEIKQIEAIRGPASAVWGANAMNGVINVITKSPREMLGTTVTFGAGSMNREVNDDGASAGSMFYVRGTFADAVNERWSYKISAGGSTMDAFPRPTGLIPNGGTTSYPNYVNEGSTQPKLDVRVDYDFADPGRKLTFAGGTAGTDGMMHTGIGPFRIHSGATMSYWKAAYTKNAFKLQAFMNFLHGEATNVVSVDPAGNPIGLDFDTTTTDAEIGDSRILGGKHVLTYGGNLRFNHFNLTIAPPEDSRTEGGGYVQDEFMISQWMRVVAGFRVDKFTSIDDAVFSPRVAMVLKPAADQSVRASYNRAFRAPSMVHNQLNTVVATPIPLGLISPFYGSAIYMLPTTATGNKDLTEEYVDAFEVAYTASIRGRATVSAAAFYTKYQDGIYFTTVETWQTAPPGFPGLGQIPGSAIWANFLAQSGLQFPKTYTYRNLGDVKNKGIELGLDGVLSSNATAFVTYAYQAEPVPSFPGLSDTQALAEINLPSKHLFSIGMTGNYKRAYGTISVSHASEAFWQDVLDARYSGYTKPYTSVNFTIGTKWSDGRYGLALKATNIANQSIQQHIFGDIIKRMVVAEFRVAVK
jgi:outer membrane receptor protein involved in Fe transport